MDLEGQDVCRWRCCGCEGNWRDREEHADVWVDLFEEGLDLMQAVQDGRVVEVAEGLFLRVEGARDGAGTAGVDEAGLLVEPAFGQAEGEDENRGVFDAVADRLEGSVAGGEQVFCRFEAIRFDLGAEGGKEGAVLFPDFPVLDVWIYRP